MSLHRTLALSDHILARCMRAAYRWITNFSVPAPRIVFWPLLTIFLVLRHSWYFLYRVFVCEPVFKAYCRTYGKNVHTGVYIHWVQGSGDLVLGNDVTVDGKCCFTFAARLVDRPTLSIGDHSDIGHGCTFTVGDRITIGRHCMIASGVLMFDSPGHPLDPVMRRAGMPPERTAVRPIIIEDNVWIGTGAAIFPGVRIGKNSVVAARSVVISDVPENVVVAGNPARKTISLESDLNASIRTAS
jgi:acetyltransferase-like isoleucine patch superfamily enzyme